MSASFCPAAKRTHAESVSPLLGARWTAPFPGIVIVCEPENLTPPPISEAGFSYASNALGSLLYPVES